MIVNIISLLNKEGLSLKEINKNFRANDKLTRKEYQQLILAANKECGKEGEMAVVEMIKSSIQNFTGS